MLEVLGGRGKAAAIRRITQENDPCFLGLVETKHSLVQVNQVKGWWGGVDMRWLYIVGSHGGGGISCCWNEDRFKGKRVQYGEIGVCVSGRDKCSKFECAIVVVYGLHSRRERQILWEELSNLRVQIDFPLIFIRDFNEILHMDERKGGIGCRGSIEDFNNWIQNM